MSQRTSVNTCSVWCWSWADRTVAFCVPFALRGLLRFPAYVVQHVSDLSAPCLQRILSASSGTSFDFRFCTDELLFNSSSFALTFAFGWSSPLSSFCSCLACCAGNSLLESWMNQINTVNNKSYNSWIHHTSVTLSEWCLPALNILFIA